MKTIKRTKNFTQLPGALETRMELLRDYITPNELFFVCSAGDTPNVNKDDWRLVITGDGVSKSIELSFEDLLQLPQKALVCYLECAGNHRKLFDTVQQQPLNKRPEMVEVLWNLGGVGNAKWTGVALRDVLNLAGVKDDAYHVCAEGLDIGAEDPGGVKCPLPIEKAMDPDTLIAFSMNDEPLPAEHGFPARLLVPGWVGTYSIKWLSQLSVTTTHQWVRRNTDMYVLMGHQWPKEQYHPANGAAIAQQNIKSSLALDWPARIEAGKQTIIGYARSPVALIKRVYWSADSGKHWQESTITSEIQQYAWVQFCFEWDAKPGKHVLMTRAEDDSGASQPLEVPFNNGGYLFNAIHPHPVVVEPHNQLF